MSNKIYQLIEDYMAMNRIERIVFDFSLDLTGNPVVDVTLTGKKLSISDLNFPSFCEAIDYLDDELGNEAMQEYAAAKEK